MTIQTRWHEPSCKTPQVVVDGNVPECRSCGSKASALLRRAAEEPTPSHSGMNLPPDAPIGQMDLRWPPCVPYTRDGVPRTQSELSSGDTATLAAQASDRSLSEIYSSSLGKDHFRLLYLSGSRLIDGPIHGDLVEYPQDNCPEYETTSYTWGGEDSDAAPCKLAYFGEFWDALFLTRNCWSLLQYLRPQMGTRVVWVDAICINQNDIPERGTQVSSMSQIYRNCMRVIIYPGDHLVRREQHKFRERVRHDEMTKDDGAGRGPVDDRRFDLCGSVLQGKYITRVWIIQELILAPHSILAHRYHDLELPNNFLYRASQLSEGREWLEYMGQDHRLRQTTLLEALRMTSSNQATDPRDRIFGILGILGNNPTYSGIVPDYSISMRDCVIGALGLTLINSEEIWPLLCVTTSNSRSDYPSWAPSLDELIVADESEALERTMLLFPSLAPSTLVREDREQWRTLITIQHVDHEQHYARSDQEEKEIKILEVASELSWSQDASIDSRCGALTLRLVRLFDKSHNVIIQRAEHLVNCIRFVVEGPSAAVWLSAPWLPEMPEQPYHVFLAFGARTLDPSWGNKFPWKPRLRADDMYLLFASESEASEMFSLVGCCPLNSASFFSASLPPPTAPWALDLEEASDSEARNIQSLFDTLQQTLNYDTREQISRDRREIRCCETLPPELDNPDMSDRERSELLSEFNNKYYLQRLEDNRVSKAMLFDMIIPGKGAAAPGLLQLSLSAARAGEAATEEFIRAYTACLQSTPADFNPVIDEEYVSFTLADEDSLSCYWDSLIQHISDVVQFGGGRTEITPWRPWDILFPRWFDLQIPGIHRTDFDGSACMQVSYEVLSEPWKYLRGLSICCKLHEGWDPRGHLGLHYWFPCGEEPTKVHMPVRAKMPLRKVVEAIRDTQLNWLHRYLLAFGDKLSVDVETLLARGPRPEDRNVFLYDWPKSLVDELGFVWRDELVTFV